MKHITKEFVTDMIDFMETNNIKLMKFLGCTLFCGSNKDYINEDYTPYKYALHYENMIIPPPKPTDRKSFRDYLERKRKIITADNKEKFLKNLSISKIYGKIIYDNADEIRQILNNNDNIL